MSWHGQFSFQNARVNSTITLRNSRRPRSISTEHIHLAASGMAVIIISDDIPEVMQTCNRILIMKKGRIVGQYATTELDETSLSNKLSES